MTDMMPSGFEPWVRDYALHLGSGAVSAKTREVYLRSVQQFLAYLASEHPRVSDPSKITDRHVAGWMGRLTEHGRAASTRSVRLKSLSLFCSWLLAEGDSGLKRNPCESVPRPQVIAPVIQVPTDELLRTVLVTCEGKTFIDRRDMALLRLLADAGLRRSEAVGLDVDDLDLSTRRALVRHGKGGRARVVAYSPKTALALSRYLRARARHAGSTASPLFLSTRSGNGWRMTGGAVGEMLGRRCRLAGVEEVYPHALRHAATHALLFAGATEQDVEEQMGWVGGQMVRRYGAALRRDRALATVERLAIGDRL